MNMYLLQAAIAQATTISHKKSNHKLSEFMFVLTKHEMYVDIDNDDDIQVTWQVWH